MKRLKKFSQKERINELEKLFDIVRCYVSLGKYPIHKRQLITMEGLIFRRMEEQVSLIPLHKGGKTK